jgi:hypothetical protein
VWLIRREATRIVSDSLRGLTTSSLATMNVSESLFRPTIHRQTTFVSDAQVLVSISDRLGIDFWDFWADDTTTMDDASRQLDFSNNDCIYPIIKVIAKTK